MANFPWASCHSTSDRQYEIILNSCSSILFTSVVQHCLAGIHFGRRPSVGDKIVMFCASPIEMRNYELRNTFPSFARAFATRASKKPEGTQSEVIQADAAVLLLFSPCLLLKH